MAKRKSTGPGRKKLDSRSGLWSSPAVPDELELIKIDPAEEELMRKVLEATSADMDDVMRACAASADELDELAAGGLAAPARRRRGRP